MADTYPGTAPERWTPSAGFPHDANPVIEDVATQFARMDPVGDYFAVHDGGLFPGRKYTETNFGANRAKNHFQGVQRLGPPNDEFLVLSGGDAASHISQLFICRLGSRSEGREFGTNLRFSRTPPATDLVARMIAIDGTFWHAGGMSTAGDILVVPLEDDATNSSKIVFFDVADPLNPLQLPEKCSIRRGPTRGRAGAVTVTQLASGYYICAVWSDADALGRRFDFYLSLSPDFLDGFDQQPLLWDASRLLPVGGRQAKYQAVTFVTQTDGALFIIGTDNTADGSPLQDGDDVADLLRVDFPAETTRAANPVLGLPTITRIGERRLQCDHDYGNFDGAGGVYLQPTAGNGPTSGRLLIYSAYHWRIDNRIRLTEFRQDLPITAPAITDLADAWIDLFEHKAFRGRRLTILGNRDATIPSYDKILVQDRAFGDAVSSVRYQLPAGTSYRLFRDDNFKPLAQGSLVLRGDGGVHEITDLSSQKLNESISSSRYE